jgi:hypothetical protein
MGQRIGPRPVGPGGPHCVVKGCAEPVEADVLICSTPRPGAAPTREGGNELTKTRARRARERAERYGTCGCSSNWWCPTHWDALSPEKRAEIIERQRSRRGMP